MVLMAASTPAPPDGSNPAMVRITIPPSSSLQAPHQAMEVVGVGEERNRRDPLSARPHDGLDVRQGDAADGKHRDTDLIDDPPQRLHADGVTVSPLALGLVDRAEDDKIRAAAFRLLRLFERMGGGADEQVIPEGFAHHRSAQGALTSRQAS